MANRVVVQTDEQAALCRARFGSAATVVRSIAEVASELAEPASRAAFLWVGRAADYKRPWSTWIWPALSPTRFRMVLVPSDDVELGRRVHDAPAAVDNLELLGPRPRAS